MKLSNFVIILELLVLSQPFYWIAEIIGLLIGLITGEVVDSWRILDTFYLTFWIVVPLIIFIIGFILRKKNR